MPDVPFENADLWNAFWEQRDPQIREQLIVQYIPLVKYVVGRLAISLPHFLTSEDIVSFGVVGLIDAVERYEPGRNVNFSTYAIARIRGSIIDELRSLDWIPRQVRKQAREIEETMSRLDQELGRPATEGELARSMGLSVEKLQHALFDSSCLTLSLNRMVDVDNSDHSGQVMPELADESAMDPLDYAERVELSRLLSKAIRQLTKREQQVLSLYYVDELNLREIGAVLEVSESRVCQLHTKAILRLRGLLQEAMRDPSEQSEDDGLSGAAAEVERSRPAVPARAGSSRTPKLNRVEAVPGGAGSAGSGG